MCYHFLPRHDTSRQPGSGKHALSSLRSRKGYDVRFRFRYLATAILAIALLIPSSGCGDPPEVAAYKEEVSSWADRSYEISELMAEDVERLGQDIDAIVSSDPDLSTGMDAINESLDIYVPRFRKYQADVLQVNAGMSAINPPPELEPAHQSYLNGLDFLDAAISQMIRSIELLRNPYSAASAPQAAESCQELFEEAVAILDKADSKVFPSRLPLLLGLLAGWLVLAVVSVFSSRAISRRAGLDPMPYTLMCVVLGPLGILITYLVCRNAPPPPMDGWRFAPEGVPPGPGGDFPGAQSRTCPKCGARVPAGRPFCPDCRSPMPGL